MATGAVTKETPIQLTGLSTNKCNILNNDCYQIGKLVVANIRIQMTSASSTIEYLVKGFPKAADAGGLGDNTVLVAASTPDQSGNIFALRGDELLHTHGTITNNTPATISFAYICK